MAARKARMFALKAEVDLLNAVEGVVSVQSATADLLLHDKFNILHVVSSTIYLVQSVLAVWLAAGVGRLTA
jgi:hypothetical protein